MSTGELEYPQTQRSLQIKEDEKFFSRILSREESSLTNPSSRVYYGKASGAVPFLWESQPGIPKNEFCDTSFPPLTPPPSYHFNSKKKLTKKPSKFNLVHTIFPKLNVKKTSSPHVSASPSSSISSSSWSSSRSTPPTPSKLHRSFSSSQSSFNSRDDDDYESPTLALCFGSGGFRRCHSMGIMKHTFSSGVLKMLAGVTHGKLEMSKKNNIKECMDILDSMGEEVGEKAYMEAVEKFRDKGWRVIFLRFSDARRRQWLRRLDEQE